MNSLEPLVPGPGTSRIAPAASPLSSVTIQPVTWPNGVVPEPKARSSANARHKTNGLCSRWTWVPEHNLSPVPGNSGALVIIGEKGLLHSLRVALNPQHDPLVWLTSEEFAGTSEEPHQVPNWVRQTAGASSVTILDVRATGEPLNDEDEVEQFLTLYTTARNIASTGVRTQVLLFTRGAYVLSGDQSCEISNRVITCALSLSASEESPELSYRAIDIEQAESLEQLVSAIRHELQVAENHGSLSAWRQGQRMTRRLIALDVENTAPEFHLKDGQTVLITGGAGGVGVALARSLSRHAKLNLVLVGRTPLESREQSGGSHGLRGAEIRACLQELQVRHTSVIYETADICDPDQVKDLLGRIEERYGRLDGIIHAAGVVDPDNVLLSTKTPASIERVLAPKVTGARNLVSASEGKNIRFFVAFSSVAASRAFWAHGISDYAAANAFLDELCERQARRNPETRWLAINWPLWTKCGMANFAGLGVVAKSRGLIELEAEQATDIFCQLLSQQQGVVHVGCPSDEMTRPSAKQEQSTTAQSTRVARVNVHHANYGSIPPTAAIDLDNPKCDRRGAWQYHGAGWARYAILQPWSGFGGGGRRGLQTFAHLWLLSCSHPAFRIPNRR